LAFIIRFVRLGAMCWDLSVFDFNDLENCKSELIGFWIFVTTCFYLAIKVSWTWKGNFLSHCHSDVSVFSWYIASSGKRGNERQIFNNNCLTLLKLLIICVGKHKIIHSATAFFDKHYQPCIVDWENNTGIFILVNYTGVLVHCAWPH
jgi:hypothetical protein